MTTICCIEDDDNIRELILYALEAGGYATRGYADSESFVKTMDREAKPDLILLDIMLPGNSGMELLRRIRRNASWDGIPVIMLTAMGAERDKVAALDAGADDYVTKPFGMKELTARIRAVIRRSSRQSGDVIEVGSIRIDDARRRVTVGGEEINLTFKEYELLKYLTLSAGLVCSREQLLEEIWGFGYVGESRTVDVHIGTLRQKLGNEGSRIETVRQVGYRMKGDKASL